MRKYFILVIIILTSLYSCSRTNTNWPEAIRTSYPALPSYPNAQQEENHNENGLTGFPIHIVTFLTHDSSQNVETFYKNELTKLGWESVDPQSLVNKEACPIYTLYISTTPSNAALNVELRLIPEPCVDR
jgi:hypothetical protein